MAGEAASGCPTAGLHRVERCCSTAVTGMAASGTRLTLALFPHCRDERTFVQACGATELDPKPDFAVPEFQQACCGPDGFYWPFAEIMRTLLVRELHLDQEAVGTMSCQVELRPRTGQGSGRWPHPP